MIVTFLRRLLEVLAHEAKPPAKPQGKPARITFVSAPPARPRRRASR